MHCKCLFTEGIRLYIIMGHTRQKSGCYLTRAKRVANTIVSSRVLQAAATIVATAVSIVLVVSVVADTMRRLRHDFVVVVVILGLFLFGSFVVFVFQLIMITFNTFFAVTNVGITVVTSGTLAQFEAAFFRTF